MFEAINSVINVFTMTRLNPWQALGDTLLVGEGNMSFAKSILTKSNTQITHMIATTFEKKKDLSEETLQNADDLKHLGVIVVHDVDATKLENNLAGYKFDTIIFQFPNVGSRKPEQGQNPNSVLIEKFLETAKVHLNPNGKIIITTVDSPYYQGVFQFEEAAEITGFETPESYPFDPSIFSGYSHTNTNDEESALDDHNQFVTWVFRLKE